MGAFALFAAYFQQNVPIVIRLPDPTMTRSGQEYGPGVKRLDPGTVNLPFGADGAVNGRAGTVRPQVLIIWIKKQPRPPKVGPERIKSACGASD